MHQPIKGLHHSHKKQGIKRAHNINPAQQQCLEERDKEEEMKGFVLGQERETFSMVNNRQCVYEMTIQVKINSPGSYFEEKI